MTPGPIVPQAPTVPAWTPSLEQRRAAIALGRPGAVPAVPPAARATAPAARAVATPGRGELTRHARIAATIQILLGSYLGLAGAILAAAAAASPTAADDTSAGTLAGVRIGAIVIGIVATIGGRLAQQGSVIGRASGVAFGLFLGFFAAAAVVFPIEGVPSFITVPMGLVVLGLTIYLVAVDLLAWHRS